MEYLTLILAVVVVYLVFQTSVLTGRVRILKGHLKAQNEVIWERLERLAGDTELLADNAGMSFKTVEFKKRLLVRSGDAESRVPTRRPFSKPKLKKNG